MIEKLKQKQFDGLLLCAKYAFMPNKLEYCGGDKNNELFEYGVNQMSDPFLAKLLKEFQTLYPYLKLIADCNKITDIYDYRVVHAYWIGNELLDNTNMNKFYWHFIDGLQLKRKIKQKDFDKITGKIPRGALPHHSFHVFNIWLRTGHIQVPHTVETMNKCRISWGKITKVDKTEVEIESPQLELRNNTIQLTEPKRRKIKYSFYNKSFIKPKIGQFISHHWGWACDVISEQDSKFLEKYTLKSIQLANLDYNS